MMTMHMMGRSKRAAIGGIICHGLHRANARLPIFENYEDFERILEQAVERTEDDRHFITVCRYVERNAPRAKFVAKA
jgi:predicted transcriptional regulator